MYQNSGVRRKFSTAAVTLESSLQIDECSANVRIINIYIYYIDMSQPHYEFFSSSNFRCFFPIETKSILKIDFSVQILFVIIVSTLGLFLETFIFF